MCSTCIPDLLAEKGLSEIDASLQDLSIGNRKCDAADEDTTTTTPRES